MKYSSQDPEELEYRVAKSAFFAVTDSIIDTQGAIKVLAITVTAEIGAFAMLYVSKDKVLDFLASGDVPVPRFPGKKRFRCRPAYGPDAFCGQKSHDRITNRLQTT